MSGSAKGLGAETARGEPTKGGRDRETGILVYYLDPG